jgi:hypothetical protein
MKISELLTEGVWVKVRRDVKNPEKLVFDGYTS